MANVSLQEKQPERIKGKSLLTHSKFFVLHQNKEWGDGAGECLKGMRILWEEQSSLGGTIWEVHIVKCFLSTLDADMQQNL